MLPPSIACPLPNFTIEWLSSGMGNNGPKVCKKISIKNSLRLSHLTIHKQIFHKQIVVRHKGCLIWKPHFWLLLKSTFFRRTGCSSSFCLKPPRYKQPDIRDFKWHMVCFCTFKCSFTFLARGIEKKTVYGSSNKEMAAPVVRVF